MVEANQEGDGMVRNVPYAVWRHDKPADEGYSRELVNYQLEAENLDNLNGIPEL